MNDTDPDLDRRSSVPDSVIVDIPAAVANGQAMRRNWTEGPAGDRGDDTTQIEMQNLNGLSYLCGDFAKNARRW